MAATAPSFGGGAGPWIVDTNAGQVTGAVCTGIAVTGLDGADIASSRIGTGVTAEIIVDTDGDLATPI